jgi:hypothetical protein
MYPMFHCCRRRCHCRPVCGRFVIRDGSAPPALAAFVVNDWRFGRQQQRQLRGRASSSGGQSIPNINCTMTSLSCSLSLIVSVIVVVGVVLLKCPSQSRLSGTYKKSHGYSPDFALVSLLSSVVTLLPLLPSQSSRPMNRDDIDRGHQHCHGRHTPHRHCGGARRRHNNQAEEDHVCQTEVGVVQAASGVGTVTSVVLLLLHCLRPPDSGQRQRRQRRRRLEEWHRWWQQHR